uniref:Uncharacterized protein n=1 Tax=Arundo donax TaxID=35708 RepID=A0A0A9TWS1_ARUDO
MDILYIKSCGLFV